MPQAPDWNALFANLAVLVQMLKDLFGPTPTPKQQAYLDKLTATHAGMRAAKSLPKCPSDDLHCHCCEVLERELCVLADVTCAALDAAANVQQLQECCEACKPS